MLPDELERLAARHVPGKGKILVEWSGSGVVNDTYRVLRDGVAYAVRVASAAPGHAGIDRRWEARVLESAALAGIAPVVEFCDPEAGLLVTRWVDGRSWNSADARRPANLSRVAELLRKVHALPLPTPTRRITAAQWIDRYSDAAGGDAADLRAGATRRLAALAALPTAAPVVCHGDLHLLNLIDRCPLIDRGAVLDGGPALTLLDWEYAHASEPLWDIAGWSANNDLEDSPQHELLSAYLGRRPSENEHSRLRLMVWLYDYVCLLWSEPYMRPAGFAEGAPNDPRAGVTARAPGLAARLRASEDRLVEPDNFRHTTKLGDAPPEGGT